MNKNGLKLTTIFIQYKIIFLQIFLLNKHIINQMRLKCFGFVNMVINFFL